MKLTPRLVTTSLALLLVGLGSACGNSKLAGSGDASRPDGNSTDAGGATGGGGTTETGGVGGGIQRDGRAVRRGERWKRERGDRGEGRQRERHRRAVRRGKRWPGQRDRGAVHGRQRCRGHSDGWRRQCGRHRWQRRRGGRGNRWSIAAAACESADSRELRDPREERNFHGAAVSDHREPGSQPRHRDRHNGVLADRGRHQRFLDFQPGDRPGVRSQLRDAHPFQSDHRHQ